MTHLFRSPEELPSLPVGHDGLNTTGLILQPYKMLLEAVSAGDRLPISVAPHATPL